MWNASWEQPTKKAKWMILLSEASFSKREKTRTKKHEPKWWRGEWRIHGATTCWDGGEKERGAALTNGIPCLAHPQLAWLCSQSEVWHSTWSLFNVLRLNYLIRNLAGATGTGAGARRMDQIISLESGLIFNYEMGHFGGRRWLVHESSVSWIHVESGRALVRVFHYPGLVSVHRLWN